MPKLVVPKRAVWSRVLPEFAIWLGLVGALFGAISLISTGASNLSWWVKIGILFLAVLVPTFAYAIWNTTRIIWQRVKQYDFLYDGFELAISNNQQLQENFRHFLQILKYAGLNVFDVTSAEWGTRSPLLVIACSEQGLSGRKLVVVDTSTLDILGRFEVVQPIFGGYLAQEDRIENAVWWGYLHEEVAKYAHPRIKGVGAILLH